MKYITMISIMIIFILCGTSNLQAKILQTKKLPVRFDKRVETLNKARHFTRGTKRQCKFDVAIKDVSNKKKEYSEDEFIVKTTFTVVNRGCRILKENNFFMQIQADPQLSNLGNGRTFIQQSSSLHADLETRELIDFDIMWTLTGDFAATEPYQLCAGVFKDNFSVNQTGIESDLESSKSGINNCVSIDVANMPLVENF